MVKSILFFARRNLFLWVEGGAIGALFLLQGFYFWILPPNFLDEGIWLELTHFVAHGLKPYIDFPSVYGPYYLRILSFGVATLGGKLIHLRLFMGCFQGLLCFLLLRWALRGVMNRKSAFAVCLLATVAIGHPSLDATMFWGLRYYSALIWIVPLCLDMTGHRVVARYHRICLYFFWGTLFFYSGEAGVISAPVLFLYLLFRYGKYKSQLKGIIGDVALGLGGIFVSFLILGKEAWLYIRELLIDAPSTYRLMGFSYPPLSLATIHFYFPFFLLILSIAFTLRNHRPERWGIWAAVAALIPALKVATSRSDEVHLGYAYPFVIFLGFLLGASYSSIFTDRKYQSIFKGVWTSLILFCLMLFLSSYDIVRIRAVYASIQRSDSRTYNSNFGIWMPNADYNRLKQSSTRIQSILSHGSKRLFVFPFQQILYSEYKIDPLHIEPIQPCSLKSTRAKCSRNFNETYPDLVVWVPENTMYSWPFDAYYASFEYPEAFETLGAEFFPPESLGETGWFLFRRKMSPKSGTAASYFHAQAEDLEECPYALKVCPYLNSMTSVLRLPSQNTMACKRPAHAMQKQFTGAFGVQFSREVVQSIGSEPAWICKGSGTAECVCSRIRKRSDVDGFYSKWAWANFFDSKYDDASQITLYGIAK